MTGKGMQCMWLRFFFLDSNYFSNVEVPIEFGPLQCYRSHIDINSIYPRIK